jgi:hypothetical protein
LTGRAPIACNRPVIRAPKDLGSGALFMVIGGAAIWIARAYPLGSPSRMGPGYFPTALGAIVALIGLALVVRSLRSPGEAISAIAWRPLLCITGAMVLFAALVRGAGLIVALPALVLISALASPDSSGRARAALAVGLTAFSVLVFVRALGLPLPVVGSWLAGAWPG